MIDTGKWIKKQNIAAITTAEMYQYDDAVRFGRCKGYLFVMIITIGNNNKA